LDVSKLKQLIQLFSQNAELEWRHLIGLLGHRHGISSGDLMIETRAAIW
jgi:hypothetical protein